VQSHVATIWDPATGQRLNRTAIDLARDDSLLGVSFSPDGRLLLAVSGADVGHVLDGHTLKPIVSLPGDTSAFIHAFSPDGRLVITLSSGGAARILRARTGEELARMTDRRDSVTSTGFSPDGRLAVTTVSDNLAHIWSVPSGRLVAALAVSRGSVFTAAFQPDNRSLTLMGPGHPPTVARCDLCGGLDELLALADKRITRDFTPRERATYLHER
jgi:WD40 repeat protein